MTIRGSCLCGAVRFEVKEVTGPFEICHCNRCRKVSGSQGMAAIYCKTADYRMTEGAEYLQTFEAPILHQAPAYSLTFCRQCGSVLPPAKPCGDIMELPAGLLDDDPGIKPDKHIFVEHLPGWDDITDGRPTFTREQIVEYRERN